MGSTRLSQVGDFSLAIYLSFFNLSYFLWMKRSERWNLLQLNHWSLHLVGWQIEQLSAPPTCICIYTIGANCSCHNTYSRPYPSIPPPPTTPKNMKLWQRMKDTGISGGIYVLTDEGISFLNIVSHFDKNHVSLMQVYYYFYIVYMQHTDTPFVFTS